jgi:hypothetical protein
MFSHMDDDDDAPAEEAAAAAGAGAPAAEPASRGQDGPGHYELLGFIYPWRHCHLDWK